MSDQGGVHRGEPRKSRRSRGARAVLLPSAFPFSPSLAADEKAHINYAWRSIDAVTYERYAPGEQLRVRSPNSRHVCDCLPSELVLHTRALETCTRNVLSHCAHYYYNRRCDLGAECQFIHAVFIATDAPHGSLAPTPRQIGRAHRTTVGQPPPAADQQQQPVMPHPPRGPVAALVDVATLVQLDTPDSFQSTTLEAEHVSTNATSVRSTPPPAATRTADLHFRTPAMSLGNSLSSETRYWASSAAAKSLDGLPSLGGSAGDSTDVHSTLPLLPSSTQQLHTVRIHRPYDATPLSTTLVELQSATW